MNDADYTQDHGLTTEQIAAAGHGPARDDVPVMADNEGYADDGEGYEVNGEGHEGNGEGYASDSEGYADGSQRYEDAAAGLVAEPAVSGQAVQGAPDDGDRGSVPAGRGSRASLLEDGELRGITMRWKDIQAEFVDEPQKAVQEADALVAELMQRLAVMFATERAELENRWAGGDQVSTEDLRQGLRRYRSFFERLLAA
jgi:hypothetical protein